MNPILYESGTITFTNNGIGRLSDCTRCEVTEERNGVYEVEFDYPITGAHYSDIIEGRIISVTHDEQKDRQPFIIYQRTAPLDGVVTFYAYHVSYLLSNIPVEPFSAISVTDALGFLTSNAMITNPFTFWTDNTTAGSMDIKIPMSARALLGGVEGSILDVYGGEYEFDNYIVRNYSSRGANNGVTIRYGKNLTDLTQEFSIMGLYDSAVGYWAQDDVVVIGGIVSGTGQTRNLVSIIDLSSEFEEEPTVPQLNGRTLQYLNANRPWVPSENLKIDFVSLWQTDEYADIAPLERVRLCDTVTVIYPDLGVQTTAKVIKVVWNALEDRYSAIELGEAKASFADTIIKTATKDIAGVLENVPTKSYVQGAIDHATELITGGLGGNIVFIYDADGKPTEMLVMDTDDPDTAIHVLRINVNGIAFSSTGINGPYTSAWTLDGQFVADFITAGSLSANLITSGTLSADLVKGGTLKLGAAANENGTLEVYDANNNLIGTWSNDGINAIGDLQIKVGLQETRSIADGYIFYHTGTQGIVWGSHAAFYTRWRSASTNKVIGQTLWTQGGSTWQEVAMTVNTEYKRIIFANCDVTDLSEGTRPTSYTRLMETVGDNVYELGLNENGTGRDTGLYMKSGTSQYAALGQKLGSQTVNTTGGYVSIEADQNGFHVLGGTHYIRVGSSYRQIDGNTIQVTTSSKRYKHDITDQISDELDPHRLYDLKMKQFVYNDDHEPPYANMKGKTIPGFIAEDVAEVYPAAVIESGGKIESWSEAQIVPPMLALIQEQKKTIDSLEARIEKLENVLNKVLGVTQ